MKIYARQINPMHQEPYVDFECEYQDVAICGNGDYHEHLPHVFKRVRDELMNGDLGDYLAGIANKDWWYTDRYATATEAINDYLYPEKEKKYSTRDIHKIKEIFKNFGCSGYDEDNLLCELLEVVTGYRWDSRVIRGCCQGDWNYVYYPSDSYTDHEIREIEAFYFNTGSEWMIHDGEDDPETVEDISGYCVYACSEFEDGVRAELAEAAGCELEEIVMFSYDEYNSDDLICEIA